MAQRASQAVTFGESRQGGDPGALPLLVTLASMAGTGALAFTQPQLQGQMTALTQTYITRPVFTTLTSNPTPAQITAINADKADPLARALVQVLPLVPVLGAVGRSVLKH
jgi:hypothetical protein